MFVLSQILTDIEEVLGTCNTDLIFRRLDSALDLLQPMLPTDSNIGFLDLCTQNCVITLPDFVEIPLAVNVAGHPADFRNKWYEHHLNGPGSECCGENCTFGWENQGLFPCFRDLMAPSYLIAMSDASEGTPMPSMIVYGLDEDDKPLYSCQGTAQQKPGLILPITSGVFSLAILEGAPKVKTITQIFKPITNNFVRLVALDSGRANGTLIGYYRPEEQSPAYRRVKLSGTCNTQTGCSTQFAPEEDCCSSEMKTTWARMRYQRRQQPITSINDVIFVPSREAVINAVEAIKQYRTNNKEEGDKFLGFARAALEEKQESLEGPNNFNAQYPNEGTYGGGGLCNMI